MSTPHRDDLGSRFGMWLFLCSELILFGGLFLLYAVALARHPAGFVSAGKELELVFGAGNTVVLLTSSLTAAMAVTAFRKGSPGPARWLLGGTIALAVLFLVNKGVEWGGKFSHGLYPGAEAMITRPAGEQSFFALYYVTTGLHGVHVLIGALLLGWVALLLDEKGERGNLLENSVLYWHLVDLIWIFIFPLYYLLL